MKKTIFCFLFLMGIFAFAGGQKVQAQLNIPCVVNDTSGTPLNVRATPGGRIVSKLKNGTKVIVVNAADGDGPGWSQISVIRKGKRVILGWVTSRYLSCEN
ncbi:MAG TPA: SH3 domain-containing protein [Pyrinomonadaceae bacterium]|nr:SH3 domain-containing protein [Pyrinomonadaceae bacterium]